jgi:hypothetical protein
LHQQQLLLMLLTANQRATLLIFAAAAWVRQACIPLEGLSLVNQGSGAIIGVFAGHLLFVL